MDTTHIDSARCESQSKRSAFSPHLEAYDGWLRNPVTGDEKWILYSNDCRSARGSTKVVRQKTPKPDVHAKRVTLFIWWIVRGVEYWIDGGTSVTTDVHSSAAEAEGPN